MIISMKSRAVIILSVGKFVFLFWFGHFQCWPQGSGTSWCFEGICGAEAEEPCAPGEALNAGQVVEWVPVLENISLEMLSSKDFFFSTSSSLALFFFLCSFCFLLWTPNHTETVSSTPTKTPRSNPLKVMVVDK